jgi:hypothetical protein
MPIDNMEPSFGLLNITQYDTRSSVGDAPEIRVAKRRGPGIPRAGASFYSAAKLARFLRIEQENLRVNSLSDWRRNPARLPNPDGNGLDSGLATP